MTDIKSAEIRALRNAGVVLLDRAERAEADLRELLEAVRTCGDNVCNCPGASGVKALRERIRPNQ